MIKAGYRPDPAATLQVGSVQTLARRLDKLPSAALLIIDEAHHSAASSYLELLRRYESAYVLGLTATPARIDGQGFQFIYDALILGHSVAQLIADGHLCPYRLFAAPKAIDTSGVPVVAGEYNQRQLAEAVNTRLVMGDLIETWHKMQELRTQQQERNLKPIWVYYTLRDSFDSLSYGDLRECARILGYKPGWAWYKVPG